MSFELRRVAANGNARLPFDAPPALTQTVEITTTDSPFGPVIYAYTRQQAIEDGELVQLSGDGYEGDDWVPKMVAEAGIVIPLAMTSAAWHEFVTPLPESSEQLAPCQDVKGRLWDVLWMTRLACQRSIVGESESVGVALMVRGNIRKGSRSNGRVRRRVLKCVVGPGDNAEPVMTLMLPGED